MRSRAGVRAAEPRGCARNRAARLQVFRGRPLDSSPRLP